MLVEKFTVLVKYSDFADVVLKKLANILPKQAGANKHVIELEQGKQPAYRLMYSLGPVEFEILQTYIKTNLANNFIKASKSLAGALILFDRKSNNKLYLCIDY